MKIKCTNCKDTIESKYPGQWVSCSCFKNEKGNLGIYIDSCRYDKNIIRIGGNYTPNLEESKE